MADRPLQSLILGVVMLIGGLITLASGAGYMGDSDVNEFVAALDVIAGLLFLVSAICIFIGGRQLFWKIVLASIVVMIIAAVGNMTITVVGGIVLIVICVLLIWWIHTPKIRRWLAV